MAGGPFPKILRYLRRTVGVPADGQPTDRHLLQCFAAGQDQDAFTRLVERHGPMVLGVCQRLLRNPQDAEDAFQATFLVLASKAGSMHWQESVGGWLHEVSNRVALKARAQSNRRRTIEEQVIPMPTPDHDNDANRCELRTLLDEELRHLPDKYRCPLVLCYLEGKTNDEAAQLLGWSRGTVAGRLARARDLLRARLSRRGLALAATALVAALSEVSATAAVPTTLVAATVRSAALFAAGQMAVGTANAPVTILAEGVLSTMKASKMKMVALIMLALGVLGGGTGALAYLTRTSEQPAAWGVPAPEVEPNKEANHLTISEPITMNGAEFQVVAGRVWTMPGPGVRQRINLGLRITNRSREPLRFFEVWMPSLVLETDGGRVFKPQHLPGDAPGTNPGSPIVTIEPGQSHSFSAYTDMTAGDNSASIADMGHSPPGDHRPCHGRIVDVVPGKYRACLIYDAPGKDGTWQGKVQTAPVTIDIKAGSHIASPPVTANEVEFQALTDPVWMIPTPVQHVSGTTIALGLRITNHAQQNMTFTPYLSAVVLETADGKPLAPRPVKLGLDRAGLPRPVPPLIVNPGKSGTIILHASIQRPFNALRGDPIPKEIWLTDTAILDISQPYLSAVFDGLAPGKYRLSLVYEYEAKGKPSLPDSGPRGDGKPAKAWIGKVQTAPVEVEVKLTPYATSKPVTQYNAEFQLATDAVWTLPTVGGRSGAPDFTGLYLRITNRAREAATFTPYLSAVVLETADGKRLTPRFEKASPGSMPLKTVAAGTGCIVGGIRFVGHSNGSGKLVFSTPAQVGFFDGVTPGRYRVSLVYESDGANGTWQGKVQLPALEVEIKPP